MSLCHSKASQCSFQSKWRSFNLQCLTKSSKTLFSITSLNQSSALHSITLSTLTFLVFLEHVGHVPLLLIKLFSSPTIKPCLDITSSIRFVITTQSKLVFPLPGQSWFCLPKCSFFTFCSLTLSTNYIIYWVCSLIIKNLFSSVEYKLLKGRCFACFFYSFHHWFNLSNSTIPDTQWVLIKHMLNKVINIWFKTWAGEVFLISFRQILESNSRLSNKWEIKRSR